MINPKITYKGYRQDVLNGNTLIMITFANESSTELDATWTVTTSTGDVTYSITNDNKRLIIICELTLYSTLIELTLTGGYKTSIRLVCDSVNIFFAGLNIDTFTLPTNNVQFDVSGYTESIIGNSTATFSLFTFDATTDGIIDDSSSLPVVFSHVYNNDRTATIGVTSLVGALSHTVGVEPYLDECDRVDVRDLIVDSIEDCTVLEVWSQTANYVEKLIGRGDLDNSEMSHLGVTISVNCCESNPIEFQLSPLYEFSLSASSCIQDDGNSVTIGADLYNIWNTTITVNGVDPSLISQLRFSGQDRDFPTTLVLEQNAPLNTFVVEYLLPDSNPGAPVIVETYLIEITTTAGFVYNLEYELTPNTTCNNIGLELTNIEYPVNPCYVTVVEENDRTYLRIDSQVFSDCIDLDTESLEAMSDGIYTVTLSDSDLSNESVTGCEFVNCETYCLVVEALTKSCDPIISILYDALVDSKLCSNITCENKCNLYEMLRSMLEACDCANYTNNRVVNKAPCKTCK